MARDRSPPHGLHRNRGQLRAEGDVLIAGVQHDTSMEPVTRDGLERTETGEVAAAHRRRRLDLDPDDGAVAVAA